MASTTDQRPALLVVKLGGSLLDLPDLATRLTNWLSRHQQRRIILIPGGGAAADVVRQLDAVRQLGDERAHWLALAAMRWNAHFLASLLTGARVSMSKADCETCWGQGELPVLDAFRFGQEDATSPDPLPHSWAVTSDAIAAQVALRYGAEELVVLKSVDLPEDTDWRQAARRRFVDAYFPQLACRIPSVRAVNLRSWQP